MLDRPELRQLKQRIALRADLAPLGVRQVAAYVAGRIRKAGGDPLNIFTKDAIVLVHRVSGGIPRTIWYVEFEWANAAGRSQVAALVVKNVIAFALVAWGVALWLRLRRRIAAVEAGLGTASPSRSVASIA